MATKRDYYDVLGVNKNSSEDEIKRAYRTLAKKYHPDVSKEANAEAKFKEVQEAYDTLSEPNKKSAYDQYGHEGSPFDGASSGFGGFSDISDIFSSFFGGSRRSQNENPNMPADGADIKKSVSLTFMEAVLGTTKVIKYDIEEECHHCHGSGADSKKDLETCDRCHGQGYITVEQHTIFGPSRGRQTCSKCGGRGRIVKNRCHVCNGNERVRKTVEFETKIPAGIDENTPLKVTGRGYGGKNGGEPGDLYLTFDIKRHKVFVRKAYDIYLDVPLTFFEATLGTTIDIPTIYGDVSLKIPAGIDPDTQLKIKEKGISNPRTGRKGDQIVTVNIKTPKNLSNESREIFKKLENDYSKEKKTIWTKFKDLFK